MLERYIVWVIVVFSLIGALVWNGSRFVDTKSVPRSKDVTFLPSPAVARALSLGQRTTVAKLRWIDSFAYFTFQLDRLDDTVGGADRRGGFERLYETLIGLDPKFLPFYEHATLTTGGILKHHQAALSFIMQGLLVMPRETGLWRLASAVMAVHFNLNIRIPGQFDSFLRAWADMEDTEVGKQRVFEWRRGLAFQNVQGLQTLVYWVEQLGSTKPGTPLAKFVETTIRELLAAHALKELPHLIEDVSIPLMGPLVIDPVKVRKRYPDGVPGTAPVEPTPSGFVLRADPFGWPFRRNGAEINSPGYDHCIYIAHKAPLIDGVESASLKRGQSPKDVAEAATWGFTMPQPPDGGIWVFDRPRPTVVWPEPPAKPWELRAR